MYSYEWYERRSYHKHEYDVHWMSYLTFYGFCYFIRIFRVLLNFPRPLFGTRYKNNICWENMNNFLTFVLFIWMAICINKRNFLFPSEKIMILPNDLIEMVHDNEHDKCIEVQWVNYINAIYKKMLSIHLSQRLQY